MTPSKCATVLTNKISQQADHFSKLLTISQQQHTAVDSGNFAIMDKFIAARDSLLKRLDVINLVVKTYSRYWNSVRHTLSEEETCGVDTASAELARTLHELKESDQELARKTLEALNQTNEQLAKIKRGKVVAAAYRRPLLQPLPRFISKLSKY